MISYPDVLVGFGPTAEPVSSPRCHDVCQPVFYPHSETFQCHHCRRLFASPVFWQDDLQSYLTPATAHLLTEQNSYTGPPPNSRPKKSLPSANKFFKRNFAFLRERTAAVTRLLELRRALQLSDDAYFTAVAYFDAICASAAFHPSKVQELADACMFLSVKRSESAKKVSATDAHISSSSDLDPRDFELTECRVAAALKFQFNFDTPFSAYSELAGMGYAAHSELCLLPHCSSYAQETVNVMDQKCRFLLELSARWYPLNLFTPNTVAAACVRLVRQDTGLPPFTRELERVLRPHAAKLDRCTNELKKVLKAYQASFNSQIQSVLTDWTCPEIVLRGHEADALSFISAFLTFSPTLPVYRPKKISKTASCKKRSVAAAQVPLKAASRQVRVSKVWKAHLRLLAEALHPMCVNKPNFPTAA